MQRETSSCNLWCDDYEENYFGKYQHTEPSPERHDREVIPSDDPALRILISQEVVSGLTHERIYDVTVSGDREVDADERVREPVGNTLDIENATFTNTIG